MKSSRFACRFLALFCCLATLSACANPEKPHKVTPIDTDADSYVNERISVLPQKETLEPSPEMADFEIELPQPAVNTNWAFKGGPINHAPGHLALSLVPKETWSSSVGTGSTRRYRLLATPVMNDENIFTIDSIGRVAAFDMKTGSRLWRTPTTPSYREGDAMGGGVALYHDTIFATTGFGDVVAMSAKDGKIMWRKTLGAPLRSAPTVSENRLFVITIENETYALDATSGRVVWRHSGIAEHATIMGASSAAVHDDTVVVAYSSGELFGLRAQNGRVVWSEVLAVPMRQGALPAIADIRGLPVIYKGHVFAISHSGRMVCIDERTGARLWESELGGMNTPYVVGNAVYLVTNDQTLVALSQSSGKIIWVHELQKHKDPEKEDSLPVVWSGPILAQGRLWLTNSLGTLAAFDPYSGESLFDREVAEPFFLAPTIVDNTLILLSDDGRLRAFK